MRLLIFLLLLLVIGCTDDAPDQMTIRFSLDTLEEERWQRDREYVVEAAEARGARVIVQSANSNDARQIAQCENMLTQGIDVLIIVPHNDQVAAACAESAHASGVPVVAYDRLIRDTALDLYVAFDNLRIGEMQAEYIVERVPEGRYMLIGGDPTDYSAVLYREGQLNVLQPYIDRGDITVVADPWAHEWQPIEALQHVENALTQTNNQIDAIVASNDGTAGGAIQALEEQGLAGQIPVSGQDAELTALQRIVAGTQAMTIYIPVNILAETAVEAALQLARGEEVSSLTGTINNGAMEVPSIELEAMVVDSNNLLDTIIADGYHAYEDVYANVPEAERP